MKKSSLIKHSAAYRTINLFTCIIIAVWSFTLLYSLFWLFAGSLKDSFEYYVNPFGFPSLEYITGENYVRAINKLYITVYSEAAPRDVYFFEMLFNSFYVTLVSAFLSIFVPSLVAYVTVKYDFWFNKVIHGIVVVSIVVPISSSLASQLHLFQALGMYDNLLAIIIMRWSFLGVNFLFMSGGFRGVSNDYRDAAFIDGAGHFRTFFTIMLPMIKNVFVMFFFFQVLSWWNTWDFTYIYMPSHPTLAQAVYSIQTSTDNTLVIKPVQLAISTFVIVPSLTIFFVFKDQIMQQVTFGGLKG